MNSAQEVEVLAGFVQAIGLDLDGTLADGSLLSCEAMTAVAAVHEREIAVVLVTGRILGELFQEFPDLVSSFDAVVAENGAVLECDGSVHDLAPPVDEALFEALTARGEVPVRRGRVILACSEEHFDQVVHHVQRSGLDCQLVRNRSALMVLPAGVSKGTGFLAALAHLGTSPRNAIAIGDAENDLALLEAAEVGVAVANAVTSLKRHADVVLAEPDGQGVAAFLSGPVVRGEQSVRPRRRRVVIGQFADGGPATVPGAQANILICGDTGTGKSYLAGLLIEQWVGAGYTVLVIDMEGDHIGLDRLPHTVVLGERSLPSARGIAALLRHPPTSVVLDLSSLNPPDKASYLAGLQGILETERAAHGLPHWVVVDEAHLPCGEGRTGAEVFRLEDLGYCLVTYRPEELAAAARAAIDITLEVAGSPPAAAGGPDTTSTAVFHEVGAQPRLFTVARRETSHRRHWHKYVAQPLPGHMWFHFRYPDGRGAGAAANVEGFVTMLRAADPVVVEYHLLRGDFSRWLSGAIQDRELAAVVAAVERDATSHRSAEVERARDHLEAELEARYSTPRRSAKKRSV